MNNDFDNFQSFHRDNPHILTLISEVYSNLRKMRFGTVSFKLILEALRRHDDYKSVRVTIKKKEREFTIPNACQSFYVTALSIYRPDLEFDHFDNSAGMQCKADIRRLLIETGHVKELPLQEVKKIFQQDLFSQKVL